MRAPRPQRVRPGAGRQPARCAGSELDRRHRPSRVLGRVDVRHLHAHHAAVHDALDVACRVRLRARDRRDAGGVARHRHQLHVAQADAAVLAVDQHPVEAGEAQHLDDLRGREHHRAAERRFAARDLLLHAIGLHVTPQGCAVGEARPACQAAPLAMQRIESGRQHQADAGPALAHRGRRPTTSSRARIDIGTVT